MAKASGSIDLNSLRVAGEPNKYVTMVDDNGIRVHEAGAVNTNFVQINSDGMQIYNGGDSFDKQIASFGLETVIGASDSSQIYLDEDEIRGVGIDGKAFFNFDGRGRSDEIHTSQSIYHDYLKGLINNPVNETLETSFINANSTDITYTCQITHKDSGNRSVIDLDEDIEITYGTPSSQQYSVSDSIATYTITLTYDGLRSFGVSVSTNPSFSSSYYFRIWCLVWATNTTTAPKFQLGSGQAVGSFSLAEGCDTTAYGDYSHAEGKLTTAQGQGSHAEGVSTQANGNHSHAEGVYSYANGAGSHAEGASETYGASSHSEGNSTIASGDYSHAEGYHTGARGYCSHSSGIYTGTAVQGGFVIGRYNQEDDGAYKLSTDTSVVSGKEYYTKSNYGFYSRVSSPSGDPSAKSYYELKSSWNDRTLKAFVIGNGANGTNRSNALTVDWDGNLIAQGMAGVIQMFAGTTAPTGWLICDGSAVSRTTYATLFSIIGTTWGAGDGSTTFNLPDLRGRTPIGAGAGSGLTARTLGTQNIGEETHILTSTETAMKAHHHTINHGHGDTFKLNVASPNNTGTLSTDQVQYGRPTGTNYTNANAISGGVSDYSGNSGDTTAANGSAHNNMQPSAVVNFIICTGKTD